MGYILLVKVSPKSEFSVIGPFLSNEDAEEFMAIYLPMVFSAEVKPVESPEAASVGVQVIMATYAAALLPFSKAVNTYLRRYGRE